ncbi:MAG TPA: hypothetical protein P5533_09540 [Candidatus Cloacimonadota bacterium]|nr:hypothetical protein [Candidatus Cloacimonadota bacterium]
MTRKEHYQLLNELDPNDITDISEAHKKMLLAQGLKPFRTTHGQVKWANTATQIYKLSQKSHKFHLFPKKRKSSHPNQIRRRHRSRILLLIRDNWLFFLILAALAAGLLYIVRFHVFF